MQFVRRIAIFLVTASLLIQSAPACTIFVLADESRTLFFNNEDYSNPNTRIWFLPGAENLRGAVYLGFDDGTPQGGMNDAGLAYDWVAGFNDKLPRKASLKTPRGFSPQRMLETCAAVDEAIAFYKTHWEESFSMSRILIADATGASVIIGAENGKLMIDRAQGNRGFGYGQQTLTKALAQKPTANETAGLQILNACAQPGQFATKYSNIFDLRARKLSLFRPGQSEPIARFDLAAELKKGGHVYDIPKIESQLSEPPQPLPALLRRFPIDEFHALPRQNPAVAARVQKLLRNAAAGRFKESDYAPAVWKEISANLKKIQADLKKFGKLRDLALVEEKSPREFICKIRFTKGALVQRFEFDDSNRFAGGQTLAFEMSPK